MVWCIGGGSILYAVGRCGIWGAVVWYMGWGGIVYGVGRCGIWGAVVYCMGGGGILGLKWGACNYATACRVMCVAIPMNGDGIAYCYY